MNHEQAIAGMVTEAMQFVDFSEVAEVAKAACIAAGRRDVYEPTPVGSYYLPAWRAKIVEARLMAELGAML